jgi:ubiquitin C-terminal hydrolase
MALQPVWQCPKCFHTSKSKKVIETCDKSHKSITDKVQVIESYEDRAEVPHTLKVRFPGTNTIYIYKLESVKYL